VKWCVALLHTTPHLYLSAKRRSESGAYAEDDVRRLDVMRGHGRRHVTCKVAPSRPTDRVCLFVGVDKASRPQGGASAAAEGDSSVAVPSNRDGAVLGEKLRGA
jgi:hypothetical protein